MSTKFHWIQPITQLTRGTDHYRELRRWVDAGYSYHYRSLRKGSLGAYKVYLGRTDGAIIRLDYQTDFIAFDEYGNMSIESPWNNPYTSVQQNHIDLIQTYTGLELVRKGRRLFFVDPEGGYGRKRIRTCRNCNGSGHQKGLCREAKDCDPLASHALCLPNFRERDKPWLENTFLCHHLRTDRHSRYPCDHGHRTYHIAKYCRHELSFAHYVPKADNGPVCKKCNGIGKRNYGSKPKKLIEWDGSVLIFNNSKKQIFGNIVLPSPTQTNQGVKINGKAA